MTEQLPFPTEPESESTPQDAPARALQTDRPLSFFDLETTGVDNTARIVQIAIRTQQPDGSWQEFESLVNPEIPIPPGSTQVHGITDQDVTDAPTLEAIADRILAELTGDLCGFNALKFDIPILARELERIVAPAHLHPCGRPVQCQHLAAIGMSFYGLNPIERAGRQEAEYPVDVIGRSLDLTGRRVIDPFLIFLQREPRNLEAAVKMYCDREHENAHDAMADVRATIAVLAGQLAHYDDLPDDVQALHEACVPAGSVDALGKLMRDDQGRVCFAFGKHEGVPVAEVDPGYLRWFLDKDFPADAKAIVRREANL